MRFWGHFWIIFVEIWELANNPLLTYFLINILPGRTKIEGRWGDLDLVAFIWFFIDFPSRNRTSINDYFMFYPIVNIYGHVYLVSADRIWFNQGTTSRLHVFTERFRIRAGYFLWESGGSNLFLFMITLLLHECVFWVLHCCFVFSRPSQTSICMFVGVSCVTNIWGGCVQQMLRGASDILQNALGGSENIWRTWCSALILTSMVLLTMAVRVCVSSAARPFEFYIIYRFLPCRPPLQHSMTRCENVKTHCGWNCCSWKDRLKLGVLGGLYSNMFVSVLSL